MKQPSIGRVLVVDDNAAGLDAKSRILREAGWTVLEPSGGTTGFEIAERDGQFDVAIIALHLPDMSGFELCRRLKAIRPEVPVLLTSPTFIDEKGRTIAVGEIADACLTEPMEEPVLLAQARTLLRIGAAERRRRDIEERLQMALERDTTSPDAAEIAQAHLAAIVASSSEAIVSKSLEGIVRSWNEAAEQLFGYTATEMIGQSIVRLIPHDRRHEEDYILGRIRRGELIKNYETVRIRKDGSEVDISVTISPIHNQAGKIIGASKIAHDISERKRVREHERLLTREINHRAKNMLSLVQAIAQQTAATDPKAFVERFAERIQALAASQDLLVESGWKNIPMEALVRSQLSHFRDAVGTRIMLAGPRLSITAAAAQAIGLALHELATNAAKYGALSNENGRVDVAWKLDVDGSAVAKFFLSWTEKDGPPVTAPTRRGFGTTVTSRMAKMSLDGEVDLSYAPTGLVWRLTCPSSSILESRGAAPRSSNVGHREPPGAGRRRVLVVEDEALIALEVASILSNAGYEVLGPASSVAQAIGILQSFGCDAAVLDVNLGIETAEPIARLLSASGTPFLTVSGYAREQQPIAFDGAPHLGKPVRPDRLIAELTRCLAATAGATVPAK